MLVTFVFYRDNWITKDIGRYSSCSPYTFCVFTRKKAWSLVSNVEQHLGQYGLTFIFQCLRFDATPTARYATFHKKCLIFGALLSFQMPCAISGCVASGGEGSSSSVAVEAATQ